MLIFPQARGLSTSSALSAEAAKVLLTPSYSNLYLTEACISQAPIQLFGIEGRYAHALFSAASQKQALDKVEKELKSVKVVLIIEKLDVR